MGDLQIKFLGFVQVALSFWKQLLPIFCNLSDFFFLGILLPKAKQAQKRWFSTQISQPLTSFQSVDWALPIPPSDSALITELMTAFFFLKMLSLPHTIQQTALSNTANFCFNLFNKTVFQMVFFPMYILWRQKWSSSKFPNGYASWRVQDLTRSCFHGCS